MIARFRRLAETDRAPVHFSVDGRPAEALAGDTLLVAVLTQGAMLRRAEFGGEDRAGFCLMGACQDCSVWTAQGERVRACSTPVTEGLAVYTAMPALL